MKEQEGGGTWGNGEEEKGKFGKRGEEGKGRGGGRKDEEGREEREGDVTAVFYIFPYLIPFFSLLKGRGRG